MIRTTLLLLAFFPVIAVAQSDVGGSNEPARGSVSLGMQYLLAEGMTPPSVKPSSPSIEYPEPALVAGLEGNVSVKVLVGPEGTVLDTKVAQSSDTIFTNAALAAIVDFRFDPAKLDGTPTELWVSIDVGFTTESDWATAYQGASDGDGSDEGWAVVADTELPQIDQEAFAKNIVYPKGEEAKGAQGVVTVRALVDTSGTVVSMEIEGTANARLAEAALQAVAKTPFTPGMESGRKKEMWTMIPVNFTLSNGEDRTRLGLSDEQKAPENPISKPTYSVEELYGNFSYSGGLAGETTVKMRVMITEEGEVSQVQVSSGIEEGISKAAAEAVRKTTFSPGTQNGEPIPVWVTVEMTIRPR